MVLNPVVDGEFPSRTRSLRAQSGFECLAMIDYADLAHEGARPFADIDFSVWPTAAKLFPEHYVGAALLCKFLIKKVNFAAVRLGSGPNGVSRRSR